ncbi:hypothetical protein THAOC_31753 [Thalassiosira oceanica]|uniref:Uncharacterized protein n=1 Tax=Thalassiosira oceanica TaxID=159749 RepID=K0R8K9_THAOC|nr:hypothetical protein THAOC_31753 [Thalassiosira oceanica]|eukprot:EJK49375.1 hypothetical protein THAOC_31753 [Thalassiosira oceanica]
MIQAAEESEHRRYQTARGSVSVTGRLEVSGGTAARTNVRIRVRRRGLARPEPQEHNRAGLAPVDIRRRKGRCREDHHELLSGDAARQAQEEGPDRVDGPGAQSFRCILPEDREGADPDPGVRQPLGHGDRRDGGPRQDAGVDGRRHGRRPGGRQGGDPEPDERAHQQHPRDRRGHVLLGADEAGAGPRLRRRGVRHGAYRPHAPPAELPDDPREGVREAYGPEGQVRRPNRAGVGALRGGRAGPGPGAAPGTARGDEGDHQQGQHGLPGPGHDDVRLRLHPGVPIDLRDGAARAGAFEVRDRLAQHRGEPGPFPREGCGGARRVVRREQGRDAEGGEGDMQQDDGEEEDAGQVHRAVLRPVRGRLSRGPHAAFGPRGQGGGEAEGLLGAADQSD